MCYKYNIIKIRNGYYDDWAEKLTFEAASVRVRAVCNNKTLYFGLNVLINGLVRQEQQ
jgi:hypothetical protein